ncbi:MAG: O-acetyl-ADP-ribose deacetylase [Opitutaceae bacterium]|nr:O-acetyl-ADP-ribose deacetylase [Opitutaceae bacterium]
MRERLKVVEGDITRLAVEVIVNGANNSLLGGGGVDGAIHDAAGPELRTECKRHGGCATGDAKLTHGYKLRAKYVIHAVGPIWKGGGEGEAAVLASCYQRALEIAAAHRFKTMAFPSISTGFYGYPLEEACRIAIRTCAEFLKNSEWPQQVTFVGFGQHDYKVYRAALTEMLGGTRAPMEGKGGTRPPMSGKGGTRPPVKA